MRMGLEKHASFRPHAQDFIFEFGRHLKGATQEQNSYQYPVRRILMAVQQGNAASLLVCLSGPSEELISF